MKKLKSNAFLEKSLADYKENPNVDTMEKVFKAFWLLAKHILDVMKFPGIEEALKNKTRTIRRMVFFCFFCFIKLPRYDATKGKAFNFFVTIMLGWLRQEYRKHRNYAELKEKYKKYAKENRNSADREQKVYSLRK